MFEAAFLKQMLPSDQPNWPTVSHFGLSGHTAYQWPPVIMRLHGGGFAQRLSPGCRMSALFSQAAWVRWAVEQVREAMLQAGQRPRTKGTKPLFPGPSPVPIRRRLASPMDS
eukprot:Skav234797  [mRNA]  locus=scaffold69:167227:167845:- [translate_table: standard]